MPAILVDQLCKTYTATKKQPGMKGAVKALFKPDKTYIEAVKNVSFQIEQGEMVGFLGPNGAGKTTTLKMLSGILHPTSGTAQVLGYTPKDRKAEMLRNIALVMGNKMQLWWDLPAWESFLVLKEIYEVDDARFKQRIEHLIDILDLGDKINTQVRKLSLGERMKCELAAALLHSPQVVFLDEPTLGLDVVSQKRIRDFLKLAHEEDNCTVLLTSHYMQDVQELCKRVIVIDHGILIFSGTLDDLSRQFGDSRRVRLTFANQIALEDLEKYGKVIDLSEETAILEVARKDTPHVTAAVLEQFPILDLSIEDVEIEDVIRRLFTREQPQVEPV